MNKPDSDKVIVYVAGPIDADHVYECWQNKVEDQTYFGTRYLMDFYSVCAELSLQPHIIAPRRKASLPAASKYEHIEYWENPGPYTGIFYHVYGCIQVLKVIFKSIKLGASAIVTTQSRPYWFLMPIARAFGIQVIPSVHCVLWPKFQAPKKVYKFLFYLTAKFFKFGCPAIMVVSSDIETQIKEITKGECKPVFKFSPMYSNDLFEGIEEDREDEFKILFVGRIEENKGVFDLLKIAGQLHKDGKEGIVFDICGNGSALEALRQEADVLGVAKTFKCHGFCNKQKIKEFYVNSSVVVVPTRTDFIEGFNKVCSEAILASKPVITSEVCPAAAEIRPAAIIVPPDDVEAYKAAILKLYSDQSLYESKKVAAQEIRGKFLNYQNSWGAKFKEIVLNFTHLSSDR